MDFELNEEQKMVRALARRFAEEEIKPHARENDIKEHFPIEIIKKMAPLGLLGGPIPERYGGAGLDHISDAIIFEEVGKACSSVRTILSVQVSLVGLTILNWGSEEQKKRYLPQLCKGEILGSFALTEPEAGSDAGSIKTSARKRGNGWVLNGSKTWISSGGVADIAIVFAQTDPSKRHEGIAPFIVENGSPGFTTKDITGKLGLRSANTAELFFEDCFVKGEALLGNIGEGFTIAMSAVDNGRYGVAAGCVGIIEACIEACVKYARERK